MSPPVAASSYEAIKDDLGYLRLTRAAECFAPLIEQARAEGWDHLKLPAGVIGEEVTATRNRRLAARLRFAHFPGRRTLEGFDFAFQPTVDRKLVDDLATLRFVKEGRPILFLGQPGCGKTHLAVALATLGAHVGAGGEVAPVARLHRPPSPPPTPRAASPPACGPTPAPRCSSSMTSKF